MADVKYPFDDIIRLIDKASIIHQKFEERKNASGENFNIFSVLRLEKNEVVLHSRFIAQLLNPRGGHNKKALFLQKFLERVGIPYHSILLLERAIIRVEDYVGPISTDDPQGGRIDITIKIPHSQTTPEQTIVIENKIGAEDQKYQLVRYKKAYPSAFIIYLTKDGKCPDKISTHVEKDGRTECYVEFPESNAEKKSSCGKHIKVSYKKDILFWLEECYQEATRLPLIRENIYQYINTVKRLTMQITDNEMAKELAEKITASEINLHGYFILRKDVKVAKAVEHQLISKFVEQTKIEAKKLGLSYDENNNLEAFGHLPFDQKSKKFGSEIRFTIPNSPFILSYGFADWRMRFFFGIISSQPKDEKLQTTLSDKFSNVGYMKPHDQYYYLLFIDPEGTDQFLATWGEAEIETWEQVYDGTAARKVIEYFKIFITALQESSQLPTV